MSQSRPSGQKDGRLDRLAARASLAIAWERAWPWLAAILTIAAVFIAVSWLGLWLVSPRWLRIGGVLLFGLALLLCLAPLLRRWPILRAEALARLDRDSGQMHRPASALEDQPANAGQDPTTAALWAAHRRRLEEAARSLRVRLPAPRLVEKDRYALRAAALIALAATAFVAGPEKYPRVLAAFDWRTSGAPQSGFRVDAWVDPPAYTGRPPLLLTGLTTDRSSDASSQGDQRIKAPVGSVVIVRSTNLSALSIKATGGLRAVKPQAAAASAANTGPPPATEEQSGADERRWTLHGDGRLLLRRYGATLLSADIASIPDSPPVIKLLRPPQSNLSGSLTLSYKIDDDYGVVGAEARFDHPVLDGKPLKGRTLVGPPQIALSLPLGPRGLGEADTTADLSDHPWAGAQVTMTLAARDEGGNEGISDPIKMTLPQRVFTKPLARALVEQRRNLVLNPDQRERVQLAIDALMIAPQVFHTSASIYLGLTAISYRLASARSDSDLLSVAALMWEMALRIENGDMSQAERDLRAAQQNLHDALQRGASDEEIRKLTEQLRTSLDKFLQALAQRQARDGQQQAQADPNQRAITPQDLQSMLNRLENMARSGDRADAQRMLDQLQNLLENLQTGQNRQSPMEQALNHEFNALDQMMRDQQALRDKTFQEGRNGGQDQNGQPPDSLRRQQQGLRQRLQEMERRMQQFGLDPKKGLGEAEGAMREAERSLGEGKPGQDEAVDAQGRALEALRQGAQSLAQQMRQNGMGQGRMAGAGEMGDDPMREGPLGSRPDPLGREARDPRFNPYSRYDPLGAPAAQRAQQVLEELRRRLANPNRSQEELDYFERLLRSD